jgi:hypothetical protein
VPLDPLSEAIARRLSEEFQGCERFFSAAEGILQVEWPSQNPAVDEPLVLDCKPEPSLHWFKGYMYDFPVAAWGSEERQALGIVDFLKGFFAERVACGVQLREGKVIAGGPVWFEEDDADAWWRKPGVLIRSWNGTRNSG